MLKSRQKKRETEEKTMQYIVLDLEWNQPRAEQKIITEPILFDSEIIEFGSVKITIKILK